MSDLLIMTIHKAKTEHGSHTSNIFCIKHYFFSSPKKSSATFRTLPEAGLQGWQWELQATDEHQPTEFDGGLGVLRCYLVRVWSGSRCPSGLSSPSSIPAQGMEGSSVPRLSTPSHIPFRLNSLHSTLDPPISAQKQWFPVASRPSSTLLVRS